MRLLYLPASIVVGLLAIVAYLLMLPVYFLQWLLRAR
jgi:hypothetical protein